MTDVEKTNTEEKISCEVCLKEIPVSGAMHEEADDYTRHFCGLDCYTKWRAQQATDEKK